MYIINRKVKSMTCANSFELPISTHEERELALQEKERRLAEREAALEQREKVLDEMREAVERRESALNWEEANIESRWEYLNKSEDGMWKVVLDKREAELNDKEQRLRRMKCSLQELERDIQTICPERHFNFHTGQTMRPKSIITGKTMYLGRDQPDSSSDDDS